MRSRCFPLHDFVKIVHEIRPVLVKNDLDLDLVGVFFG